ncbi:MAG: hypothetical protein DI537_01635 [Stutzerimonas stutzeri]|nr:MAG: hypothetical protein DI537_01635 [Stutzerimonas stutzeri]
MTGNGKSTVADKPTFAIGVPPLQEPVKQALVVAGEQGGGSGEPPGPLDRVLGFGLDLAKLIFNPARSFAKSKVGMMAVGVGALIAGKLAVTYTPAGRFDASALMTDASLGAVGIIMATIALLTWLNARARLRAQAMLDRIVDGYLSVLKDPRSTVDERKRALQALQEIATRQS